MQRHVSAGGTAASRIRVTGLLLLTVHLLLVGWLTLRPLSVPWVAPANLHPFATIRADLADGPDTALRGIGGGLLLLAPLGVLLPLAAGRLRRPPAATCARTVFEGAMISLGIALVQSGVPGQVVNVDSVLLNTMGVAFAGLLVFPPLRARLLRHCAADGHGAFGHGRGGGAGAIGEGLVGQAGQAAQGSTPRAPRVGIAP